MKNGKSVSQALFKKSQKDEDRIFVIQRWQEKAEENGPECDTK